MHYGFMGFNPDPFLLAAAAAQAAEGLAATADGYPPDLLIGGGSLALSLGLWAVYWLIRGTRLSPS